MKIVSQDSFLGGGGIKGVESTNTMGTNRFATPKQNAGWLPTSFGETIQDLGQISENVGQTGLRAYNTIADVWSNPNIGFGTKVFSTEITPVWEGLNMVGDVVLGLGKMGISQEKEDELKGIVVDTMTNVSESEMAQYAVSKFVPWYQSLNENDQELVKSVAKAGASMFELATFGTGKALTTPIKKTLDDALTTAVKLPRKGAGEAFDWLRRNTQPDGNPPGDNPPPPPPPPPAGQLAPKAPGEITDAIGISGARATSNVPTGGLTSTIGEFFERIPRAIGRGVEAIDAATARAAKMGESSPLVQRAMKSNLDDDLINLTQEADEATTNDLLKMVRIAESTPDTLVPKQNPADVAGDAGEKMIKFVENARRTAGKEIEEVSKNLAAQGVKVDMKPAYRQVIDVLRANGMLPKVNGKIKFTTYKYTPEQQSVIQKLYDLAIRDKFMSPTNVHEMSQLFSKLDRELMSPANGKIADVFVEVPSSKGAVKINIFEVFEQLFKQPLFQLAPELRPINARYSRYKNILKDLEKTLIRKGNLRANADMPQAEYLRTSLRRIFSDAASAADYKAVYNKLDKAARELGYTGARADTLSLFASRLRKLYPETIPENSFQGGISTGVQAGMRGLGMMDLAEKVLKTGTPDVRDQQRALRALLEDRANFGFKQVETPVPKTPETPTAKSEPESLVDDTTPDEIPEEAIVDTAKKIQRDLRNNPQGGYFNIVEMIKDVIGLGKRAKGAIRRKPESKMDREFRRKDEVYWESKGYRTTGDGRIEKNNRNRGMANFGAMAEDIAGVFKKKVADPTIRTKRAVDVKTVSGEKVSIPEGTVLNPMVDGSKVAVSVNGKEVVMPKNQYQNLVGQSDRAIATPFAPELKETIETVRGGKSAKAELEAEARSLMNDEAGEGMTYEEALDVVEQDMMYQDTSGSHSQTRYHQYTLPGGENYREILVQVPVVRKEIPAKSQFKVRKREPSDTNDIEPLYEGDNTPYYEVWRESDDYAIYSTDDLTEAEGYLTDLQNKEGSAYSTVDNSKNFKSAHWDEENPLFHLRMNERTFKKANDTMFMEELQSDWAREGREKGFASDLSNIKESDLRVGKSGLNAGREYAIFMGDRFVSSFATEELAKKNIPGVLKDLQQGNIVTGKVPNHPLLKNWQIPAVKRALMEAVDNKSNYFAWINGAQTSERYNLATYVDDVKWQGAKDGKWIDINAKGDKNIRVFINEEGIIETKNASVPADWKGKKLDEVLGKGLADKIMEKETGTLSGDGLSFGGEWAKNLYDRQVRDIVKKLTGAEVKTVDMGLGTGKETRYKLYGSNTFATSNNVRKGDLIAAFSDNKYEKYYVLDSYGDGTVDLIPQREVELQIQNDEELYNKYYPKSEVNGEFINVSTEEMNDAFYRAIDDGNFDTDELVETVNLDTVGSQKQQYIELTPEVKAKIQSKAPNFSMKTPSAGESLPLLLLMLGGATYAGNQ